MQRALKTAFISFVLIGLGWTNLRWKAELNAARVELKSAATNFQMQLEEKDQLIQSLQTKVQRSHTDNLNMAATFKAKAEALEKQLTQQANPTLPTPAREQPAAVSKEQHLEAIRVMRDRLGVLDGEILEARRQTRDLLTSLMVPEEIATLDSGKALDTLALKAYWPFFDAKRERENLEKSAEGLRRRIIGEEVELALPRVPAAR